MVSGLQALNLKPVYGLGFRVCVEELPKSAAVNISQIIHTHWLLVGTIL